MSRLVLLFLCCTSYLSNAMPAHVVIVRHAEKSGNGLSSQGQQHAEAYVKYFTTKPMLSIAGEPSAIYAFQPTANGHGQRGVDTMTPLSQSIGVAINTSFPKADVSGLANQVLTDPNYDGKTVLICWEHGHIPAIASRLGVKSPPKWKGSDYNHTWIIDYDSHGKVANFRTVTQKLSLTDER